MIPVPDGVRLRPATVDDAEAGGAVHVACWREAYGPLVDADLLEAALARPDRFVEGWRRRVGDGEPRLLAETGAGEVVGFASAGPSRDVPPVAEHELYAIYVRAAWWGTGLGAALLDAVDPGGPCSLWVLAANTRARRFYARRGFAPDGAETLYEQLGATEARLVRPARNTADAVGVGRP